MDRDGLSQRFTNFAIRECRGHSALYEFLSLRIAEDDYLLQLSSHAAPGQPVPNLFLAAVHYLLLSGVEHELMKYYPSMTDSPRSIENAFIHFKDFCSQHSDAIVPILQHRFVQTNEVMRCTYLYPVFCLIYRKTRKPLALVELGTSAGLQLLWEKYSYSYEIQDGSQGSQNGAERGIKNRPRDGLEGTYGDSTSSVHLAASVRKGNLPVLLKDSPPVVSKIGVDLHVVHLSNDSDYLWLKALIWPEHKARFDMLEKAAKVAKLNPVELVEGDGVALLPTIVEQVPPDSTLCIFHTHVANQMPQSVKQELMENVTRIGEKRDVFHIYNNVFDLGVLHLDYLTGGEPFQHVIGETDGHGRWFDWELRPMDVDRWEESGSSRA